MAQDKKVKGGKLALVLVRGIGEAFVEHEVVVAALDASSSRASVQAGMTLGLGITLGAILGLLLASAFFSGSETALTARFAPRKMHALEQDGNRRARVVNYLLTIRERFIGAILLGNTLANIAASALATSLFLTVFGEEGVVYATIVMTVIVVLFAEVLPKTYAILNADRMALAVAPARQLRGGAARAGDWPPCSSWCATRCGCSASRSATTPRCSRRMRRSGARSSSTTRKAAWRSSTATCWAACSISAS